MADALQGKVRNLETRVRELSSSRVWDYVRHFSTVVSLTKKKPFAKIPLEFADDNIRIVAKAGEGLRFVLRIYDSSSYSTYSQISPRVELPPVPKVDYPFLATEGVIELMFSLPEGQGATNVDVMVLKLMPVARKQGNHEAQDSSHRS